MKARTYLIIGSILLLAACTETVTVEPFTYPQVFTGETKQGWTIRSLQFLQEGKGLIPLFISSCAADDIYVFYNNPERSFQVLEGATRCNADDPQVVVDNTWSFVNSTAALTIVVPILSDSPLPFIVNEIDNTKMVLDIYLDDDRRFRINFRTASIE